MMETTDLWNGSHFAHRRWLYPARLGRVLLKRQMSPARMRRCCTALAESEIPPMVVAEVCSSMKYPKRCQYKQALLHGPEQIADLPVPVAESPGAVRIGHPERSHLVEYLAPNSVFNSLPRQRSSPHLRPDDRLVTIDRVLHHASLGVA